MPIHEQSWIKVNAPIDVGISRIVSLLSGFDQLQTIESCQGSASSPAWICFQYGDYRLHPWRDLAEFVLGFLGPELVKKVGDGVDVTLRTTGSGRVTAELQIRPGAETAVAAALESIRTYRKS